jgi:hypothetical protein
MCDDSNLILCYNRGCAVKFDQVNNLEGSTYFISTDIFTWKLVGVCSNKTLEIGLKY